MLYQGFHALFMHRIAHCLYKHRFLFLARLISQISRFFTGIEIHPGAKIGESLFIDHGMGVVIGETAEIGDNCTIYHSVTLGGTGKDTGKRHPTIGSNVLIGAGAVILGPLKVGDNAMIGGGSVVVCDVEPNTTVTGSKARPVRRNGMRLAPSEELDQIHTPDPVCQEMEKIQKRLEIIEAMLNAGKKNNGEA